MKNKDLTEFSTEELVRLIHAAEVFRDTGRIEEARALYKAVLVLRPEEEFSTLGLGICARREGYHEAALDYYHRAQRFYPKSKWPYLEAAEDYLTLQRYDEVESAWKTVLALQPGEPHALKGLVKLYRMKNDAEAALSIFQDMKDLDAETLLEYGRLLAELQHFAEALTKLREGAAKFPDNSLFLIEIAAILRLQGDLITARQTLEEAAARDQNNPIPLLRLSDMARQAHNLRMALEHLEFAKKNCNSNIWVDLCAAQVLFEMGYYARSEEKLREVEQIYPENPSIVLVRAGLLARRGMVHEARMLNATARTRNLADISLALQAAELENQCGDPAAADAILSQVEPVEAPARAERCFLRGMIAEEGWNHAEARIYYDAAMDIQPSHRGVVVAQLRLSLLDGDLVQAKERLQHFAKLEMPDRRVRGLPLNTSQSFFGQLVEEFQLQPGGVAEIRAAQAEALPVRLARLAELSREYEDWTPTAMAFLLSIRQAGLFDIKGGFSAASEPMIPQRIFQYWDTPDVPADVLDLMQSWRSAHPEWQYDLFDDAKARSWLAARAPEALRAYATAREKTQKSDIFRLAVLRYEGGWYADADDRCLVPLHKLAPASARFVGYQEEYATLGNNVLGAAAGHPIIARALESAVIALLRGDRDVIWLSTGPGMLSRSFVQALPNDPADWPAYLSEIAVLDKPSLRRAVAPHCHARYKFSGEHWSDTSFQ